MIGIYVQDFKGYNNLELESRVITIVDKDNVINECSTGDQVVVILDKTVFYSEKGGQVGDVGILYNETTKARVLDTLKGPHNQIHHIVKIEKGN